MNLPPFTGPGSTPARRRFWDQARAMVLASQKLDGKNITVDERIGKGTLINARRDRGVGIGCPPVNPCTVDVELILPIGTGTLTGKPVAGDGSEDGDHWIAEPWTEYDDCSDTCSTCGDPPYATVCESYDRWRFADGVTRAIISLDRISGDSVLSDGWYIAIYGLQSDTGPCGWSFNSGQCLYIGADDSIFSTDLELSFPVIGFYDPECTDGTINLTFHPC